MMMMMNILNGDVTLIAIDYSHLIVVDAVDMGI